MIIILVCWACLAPVSAAAPAQVSGGDIDAILSCAESLFLAQKDRQYEAIWPLLTARTKQSIVDAVHRESKKGPGALEKEAIAADFNAGGSLARAYWDGYLAVFKPEMVLDESRWTMGSVSREKAELNLLHKKSAKPAVLLLFRENDFWKVGLSETFGARSLLPF
jgi:hypothetical protein